jgi:hypothetical protein
MYRLSTVAVFFAASATIGAQGIVVTAADDDDKQKDYPIAVTTTKTIKTHKIHLSVNGNALAVLSVQIL